MVKFAFIYMIIFVVACFSWSALWAMSDRESRRVKNMVRKLEKGERW